MKRDPALDAIVVKHAQHFGNCAQTGFFSMVERCNLECDHATFQHALTAMPGIGQTGETCGGVSGPLLALGLALGPTDPKDKAQAAKCFAAAHQFAAAVTQEFGSTRCPDIIEHCCGTRFDLSNPEDAKKYVAAGGLQKCVNVVQTTVHIASGILEDAAEIK
jgi:C_GCAxxG_C_C family probable redox protein